MCINGNKIITFCLGVVLAVGILCMPYETAPHDIDNVDTSSPIYDKPFNMSQYVFNEEQDLQLPELPTGCEATALGTLLRYNGINVTKFEVADAMPKSTDGEFVYSFWGDPYSSTGWSCMAPCVVNTANMFLDTDEKLAVEYTGTDLEELPLPSAVWVTIDLQDPIYTNYESCGYKLFGNPHCVVVKNIEDGYVNVSDPLVGETSYPLSQFEYVYVALGMQAVYIENVK